MVVRNRLTITGLLFAASLAAAFIGCSTPMQLDSGLIELSSGVVSLESDLAEIGLRKNETTVASLESDLGDLGDAGQHESRFASLESDLADTAVIKPGSGFASLESDLAETVVESPRALLPKQTDSAEKLVVVDKSVQRVSADFELIHDDNPDSSLVPAVAIVDVTDLYVESTIEPVDHNFSVSDGSAAKESVAVGCRTSSGREWGGSREEYVCDGGDGGQTATVDGDWNTRGLEVEDTIAHFDTLSGDVEIVSSNRACVFAPRFAAVRQVRNVFVSEQSDSAYASASSVGSISYISDLEPGAVKQPLATVRAVGTKIGLSVQQNDRGLQLDDVDIPTESRNQLMPYENLKIVAAGIYDQKDTPILMASSAAARAWSNIEMPQVALENGGAFTRTGVQGGEEAVLYEMPEGQAKLRLVKLASVCAANAGETISFTIRFDNVGDQAIGNVSILDMLTDRLKYVAGSSECTLKTEFLTSDEGDALQLRWEVDEPLEPGEGGVIRFECIVK